LRRNIAEKRIIEENYVIRNVEDLEEAASAYKDIDVVMQERADLVNILVKLEFLAAVKG